MERTLSVNYPVLRQNKGVLLNTIESIVHQYRKQEGIDRKIYSTESNLMTVVFYERIQ